MELINVFAKRFGYGLRIWSLVRTSGCLKLALIFCFEFVFTLNWENHFLLTRSFSSSVGNYPPSLCQFMGPFLSRPLITFSSHFSSSPSSAAFKRTILIGTCYCFRQLLLLFSLIVVSSLWFESTNYLPNFHTYLSANSDDDGVGAEFAAEDV